jgi:hypothetical protein
MTDMNVISLKAARSRLRPIKPIRPPPALISSIPADARALPGDSAEDRVRMRQNFAAFAVIVCIVVLGAWLMDSLSTYSRIQTCIEAGHRNCVPVEHKYQPSPF